MTALDSAERSRLAKLLGMLGSTHPGEREAAALAADRFIRSRGAAWRQVLRPPAEEHKLPLLGTWRDTCAKCLAHPRGLRKWEVDFLTDLPKFRRLSVKQRYVLTEIATRLGVREPAA